MYDPNTAILTAVVSQHRQNLAQESGVAMLLGRLHPTPTGPAYRAGSLSRSPAP